MSEIKPELLSLSIVSWLPVSGELFYLVSGGQEKLPRGGPEVLSEEGRLPKIYVFVCGACE